MSATSVHPQWIAKMYAGKVGRDHLGLGSVSSDQILPSLSPSINVLTFHPRYHSFYIFLLDEFWRRDRPRSVTAWRSFYRPREYIYSVGSYLCTQPEHGDLRSIVGGQKTAPQANSDLSAFNTSFHYIDSSFGGYGLYYYTVMVELGLVYPGGRGMPYPIEVPSELGKKVAADFRDSIENTIYYQSYFDQDKTKVPREVVKEYIHQACLCQLKTNSAPDRRNLQDLFLHGGNEEAARSRKETFRLFLDIADQTDGNALSQDTFRQLIYFKHSDNNVSYSPQESVIDMFKRWRLYQAREYYAFALNGLWCHLCDWGLKNNGDAHALPIAQFWQYLDQALDFDSLAGSLNIPSPGITADSSLRELFNWLQSSVGTAYQQGFDDTCEIHSPIHEHRIYQLANHNRSSPHIMVAGMIAMLAMIYLRFGDPKLWTRQEWDISRMGSYERLSVDIFIRSLQKELTEATIVTIKELVRWLYEDYIIYQHLFVANRKLPDNTFRFQREGQKLRFNKLSNSLTFLDSRFPSISTSIYELGFCGDLSTQTHSLTEQGRILIEKDE